MSLQYKRAFSLVVGDDAGNGLDLSELRCTFHTRRADTQTPGSLLARIYNISDDTRFQIQQEFTHVFLSAGYRNPTGEIFGLIFKGEIRQKRAGRESPTDTFLEILAQDGDSAYNFAVVNKTLAAGWQAPDVVNAALASMSPFGITAGYMPPFASYQNPRGAVLFGMARDAMEDLSDTVGASWCLREGQLTMTPDDSVQPGEAFVLTAATGLVGLPTQTLEGVNVRCLLNPNIKFGGQIQLDNASVQQAQLSVAYGAINNFPSLDTDGFYKVFSVEHHGDTRGQDWYTDLITVAIDGTAPLTGPYLNAVASPSTAGGNIKPGQ